MAIRQSNKTIDAIINILNSFKGINTENIKTEKPTITEIPLNNIPFPDTFIVLEIASSKLSPSLGVLSNAKENGSSLYQHQQMHVSRDVVILSGILKLPNKPKISIPQQATSGDLYSTD